jgi:hypothetical protein
MLRRYRKIEVDSRFSAAEDRGHYSICGDSAEKQLSFISFYLLLSPKQEELAKVELIIS